MDVLVVHNAVGANAPAAESDVLVQAQAVSEALIRLGCRVRVHTVDLDLSSLVAQWQRRPAEVVFNLVESLAGSDRLQFLPTAVFDVLGAAYTGSPTEALLITGDKPLTKRLLRGLGLPTPDWIECHPGHFAGDGPTGATCPASNGGIVGPTGAAGGPRFLVKACWEHASLELEETSLMAAEVDSVREHLRARWEQTGRPWFAEQYVEGREFNLSILAGPKGPEVLPVAEIDFSAFPPDRLRIVGYRAKWDSDSFEYHATPRRFDFPLCDRPLLSRLESLALACWRALGLRGYARVDFRVDADGNPWILEVNANPCLAPDAGFAAAAAQAQLEYHEAIGRIVAAATAHQRPQAFRSVGFSVR